MSTDATQKPATSPKVNRATPQQQEELSFWKQCYASALTRNADSDVARMCADQGVNQLRKRIANLAPAGDCVSKQQS